MAKRAGPRGTVNLTNPSPNSAAGVYVGNGVSPQAAAYASAAKQRSEERRGKYSAPVGGPPVTIPHLDAEHSDGMTMQEQAQRSRAPQQHQQPQDSFVEVPVAEPHKLGSVSPTQMGILPTDLLPDQALEDPNFQDGMGSRLASSQPMLALKYGVVRRGQHIAPQALKQQQRGLRPETVKGLEELSRMQENQQAKGISNLHASEQEAEASAKDLSAAGSARIGNLPGDDSEKPLSDEEKKELQSAIDSMDEFDFDGFRQRLMKDILNNPVQRDIIEERLEPLKIEDMILHNRVAQTIPIVPNKFWFELQSMTTEEDLALKRMIMTESKSIEVNDRYLLDKYSLYGMAVALKSINGKPIGPTHLDAEGNFSEERLVEKFNKMIKLPVHLLASVGIHHFWFEVRVRKLFVAEKVGNG